MPEQHRIPAPATTGLGGQRQLLVGVGLLVLGGLLLWWGFGLDPDSGGFITVTALGGLALAVGVFVANAGVQRARAAAVARGFGPHDWAAVCILAERHLLLRVLVVEPEQGLHLLSLGGRRLVSWPWAQLHGAVVEPVPVQGRSRTGLRLDTDADLPHRLAFPGPSGVGFSSGLATEAATVIAHRLGLPD